MKTYLSPSHMVNFIVFMCTITIAFNIAKSQSNITRGSSLKPTGSTTSWLSRSRLYAFGFYPQTGGYRVGIYIAGVPERTVVWTANRDTLPFSDNATLRFTSDGRLIVDQTQGQQINLFDTGGASFASMQDSGNFVLYDSTGTAIWNSFDHPTETLLAGQRLLPGQTLFSSVSETDHSIGVFKLTMQLDGNLVQYPDRGTADDAAYWSTGTYTAGPNVTLNLDSTGFLYLLQNSTFLIYNLTQGGYPINNTLYVMKFDVDGIFRLYSHDLSDMSKNGSAIWASSANRCVAKGLCGINGYCLTTNDDDASCQCLPGFEVVNPTRWTIGCRRIDTLQSCKIQDADTEILMTYLNNATWEDAAYLIPKARTQEECSSACLNDCNCEAALFTRQQCKLQRLPLRYIVVSDSNLNVGLIKVQSVRSPSPGSKPRSNLGAIITSAIGSVLFLLGVVSFLIYLIRTHKRRRDSQMEEESICDVPGLPNRFSYEELKIATENFNKKLGEGGFGVVFEGTLEDGSKIAVKRLEGLNQANKSFLAEVRSIGSIHHVNLVRLRGFCAWKSQRFLVYEFMSNGSLDRWMNHGHREHKLEWKCRKKIILDVAKGLAYLHEECSQKIIHLDIKPQNILLDSDFNAKVSDFGLSKLIDKNQSHVMTTMRGTPGYLAPEWLSSIITEKVDVYSFGIVLLEMLCGRKNFDRSQPEESWHLLGVFQKCWEQGTLLDIVDRYCGDMQTHSSEVVEMMKVASWCLQYDFAKRPSMSKVVKVLEGVMKVESNLDYNFTDPIRQNTAVRHDKDTTQMLASVLSGPR